MSNVHWRFPVVYTVGNSQKPRGSPASSASHEKNGEPPGHPLEYPQFLTHEMSRMPDFIGRDEFSEVK